MTAPNLTPAFEEKKALTLMTPQAYFELCDKLLNEGKPLFKTNPVGGYLMKDVRVETLKSDGTSETTRDIKVEEVYILTDAVMYPQKAQRDLIMADIARNWGDRVIAQDQLGKDYSAPGVWVNLKKKVDADYIPESDTNKTLLVPNPEMTRLCLKLDETVKIPVAWGTFDIDAGGTFAIRERDVEALLTAVQSVKNGSATVEEALYAKTDKGDTVAKFDIYGMEPGFLENNYNAVPLKAKTETLLSSYKAAPVAAVVAPDKKLG